MKSQFRVNHQFYAFTFFRTDWKNNRIIYSQDFPVKSLNGLYEFKAIIFGNAVHTKGVWNMTLYDYA